MKQQFLMLRETGVVWILTFNLLHSIIFSVMSQKQYISFSLKEEQKSDTFIGEILSKTNLETLYDDHELQKIRFYIMDPTESADMFRITPVRGEIYTKKPIDRDTLCDIVSTCCLDSDGCYISLIIGVSPQQFFSVFNVRVNITDINDNDPTFPENNFAIQIPEYTPVNETYLIPIAKDLDIGDNDIQHYSIYSPDNAFGIKEFKSDGEITDVVVYNKIKLDRETQALYGIKVYSLDGGRTQRTGTLSVNVIVTDINDNVPIFRKSGYTVSVRENSVINSTIVQVKADDSDTGINAQVRYTISKRASHKVKATFRINSKTGWVTLKRRLNYEGTKLYHVPVEARDMGPNSRSSRTKVAVHVIDVNDNSPTIHINMVSGSQKAEIRESDSPGEAVAHVLVKDIDTGLNGHVSCSVDNSYFTLIKEMNVSSQEVYRLETAAPLNRETTPNYRVTIVCQDMGKPILVSRKTFTVSLLDINDNAPIFTKKTYLANIEENNKIDVFLLKVNAYDQDDGSDGKVFYKIAADGNSLATINQDGNIYASSVFDREQYDELRFHVLATDGGEVPLSATATVVLRIVDRNDNAPYFLDDYLFTIAEDHFPEELVGKLEAGDIDKGRNKDLHFALADNNEEKYFDVTREGTVITKRHLDREHKADYELNVVVVDHGEPPLSSATKVRIRITDVNDNPPVIKFPTKVNNTVYISYLVGVRQPFTKIEAVDADMGENGELLFYIKHGNERGFFTIDEQNGAIMLRKPMAIDDAYIYKLTIEVKDRGRPPHSKTEMLTIVVDATGKPISLFSGVYIKKPQSNKNRVIVICLAAVSGMLAIVLIVAIVCIRRKDTFSHTYSIQSETQRFYSNRCHSPSFSRAFADDRHSPSPAQKKEVSFSTENDDIVDVNNTMFKADTIQASWCPNKSSIHQPSKRINNTAYTMQVTDSRQHHFGKAVNV